MSVFESYLAQINILIRPSQSPQNGQTVGHSSRVGLDKGTNYKLLGGGRMEVFVSRAKTLLSFWPNTYLIAQVA
jgi:hypothetical protein